MGGMKRGVLFLALFVALGVGCADGSEEQSASVPASDLSPVLQHYLEAQNHLARDEEEEARRALGRLAESSEGELQDRAARAAGSDNVSEMRARFAAVSETIIQEHDIPEGYTVLHCPMAAEDEGAEWIQARGDVRNPYMGSDMLECGVPAEHQ